MSSIFDTITAVPARTEAEIKAITENIVAIHEHEGVTPSDFAIACSKKILRGDIEAEEAIALIIAQ